jgi:hypothetical protein
VRLDFFLDAALLFARGVEENFVSQYEPTVDWLWFSSGVAL